jgi:nucleotidyltransferase substrate binding protein (TIGR01987 family)
MSEIDIRWKQRLSNFVAALQQLEAAVQLSQQRALSELEKQGLIQVFEFTHELGWNVLKDYLKYQGITGLIGSRDTCREAFQKNLIYDGEAWMDMIKSRNLTSHIYQKKVADSIISNIVKKYYKCFDELKIKMSELS